MHQAESFKAICSHGIKNREAKVTPGGTGSAPTLWRANRLANPKSETRNRSGLLCLCIQRIVCCPPVPRSKNTASARVKFAVDWRSDYWRGVRCGRGRRNTTSRPTRSNNRRNFLTGKWRNRQMAHHCGPLYLVAVLLSSTRQCPASSWARP